MEGGAGRGSESSLPEGRDARENPYASSMACAIRSAVFALKAQGTL